jgi:hypothetical protein
MTTHQTMWSADTFDKFAVNLKRTMIGKLHTTRLVPSDEGLAVFCNRRSKTTQ